MNGLAIDAALEQKIADLADLSRPDLTDRWRAFYKTGPPKGISRMLLTRAVAYGMQVKATRGLKPAAKRRLLDDSKDTAICKAAVQRPTLQPGARLVREWNGMTYRVDVVEGGFIWNGAQYRSLSAIARTITGARWSGPRFFGLTSGDTS